jgi:iron complex outermembrane receptor protein
VPQRQIGSFSENWFENENQNINAQLNYTKTFGKFNVDAIAGYDYQQFDNQNYFSGNRNLFGLGQAEELREDVDTPF